MQPSLLWIAYVANIVILVPVCYSMFFGGGVGAVFDGRVAESAGLRIMVGSLWFSILVGSVIGLFFPGAMAPILLIQIVYKSLWLLVYIRPALTLGGWESVPHGITLCFLAIVLTYPVILGAHMLRAPDTLVRFEQTTTTDAAADAVWALWTDPQTWACWDRGLTRANGPTPLALASEGEIVGSAPTRFTHIVSFHGPLRGPFARWLGPGFKDALPQTVDSISAIAQGDALCSTAEPVQNP